MKRYKNTVNTSRYIIKTPTQLYQGSYGYRTHW